MKCGQTPNHLVGPFLHLNTSCSSAVQPSYLLQRSDHTTFTQGLTMGSLPKLPACRPCQQRKVKCDSNRPKCGPCSSSRNECMLVDGATGQAISREQLYQLEQRMQILSGTLPEHKEEHVDDEQSDQELDPDADAETPSAIFQGGGLSFMSSLFMDAEWRRKNAHVIRSLANATRDAELNVEPNVLPAVSEAKALFGQYLQNSHAQQPFLLRQDVLSLSDRMFGANGGQSKSTPSEHDLFRTFMIIAIGSIFPYRRGTHRHHPLGYYVAAMQHFNPSLLQGGLTPIQDLLLLSRFAVYHHIGISIWELTRVCMRMCIEQGLHTERRSVGLPPIEVQSRRRVFWHCYIMDRYSSITLNRPVSISDNDIQTGLPIDIDDSALDEAQGELDSIVVAQSTLHPGQPTQMTVPLLCIRLRQISSKIHSEFASIVAPSQDSELNSDAQLRATGQIHLILQRFISELDEWRSSAPNFEAPSCLFERDEWFNLAQARETFHLIRRAIDIAPKHEGRPSRSLLTLCQWSAARVISIYSDLYGRSLVTFTRSYFQMMFAAGLSLLYCGSILSLNETSLADECSQALSQCQFTLSDMVLELPAARQYVAVFDALNRHISCKLRPAVSRPGERTSSESQPLDMASANEAAHGVNPLQRWNPMTMPSHMSYANPEKDAFIDSGNVINAPYAVADQWSGLQPPEYIVDQDRLLDHNMWDWEMLNDDSMWNVGQFALGDPILF